MLNDILDTLRINASNDDYTSRRTHERREMDSCVGIIDGKAYPVQNWSQGGVLLTGDDKSFTVDDEKEITLKFKLADRIMDVAHTGKVIRKSSNRFVLQFLPLSQQVGQRFQQVIDDYVAQEFAGSQQF
ncbi:MAG: PilZ domain-containing protein [Alphaproteobacteria bacterium]|nr:PilZ domain-containing protein [Alphaproteobacteria bacterium]